MTTTSNKFSGHGSEMSIGDDGVLSLFGAEPAPKPVADPNEPDWDTLRDIGARAEKLYKAGKLTRQKWLKLYEAALLAAKKDQEFVGDILSMADPDWLTDEE